MNKSTVKLNVMKSEFNEGEWLCWEDKDEWDNTKADQVGWGTTQAYAQYDWMLRNEYRGWDNIVCTVVKNEEALDV